MKLKQVNLALLVVFLGATTLGFSQNLLTNGDFSKSTELKSFYNTQPPEKVWSISQDEGVEAKAVIENGAIKYEIKNPGKFNYSVQIAQGGFILEPGHRYKLSFDVKADSTRVFGIFLGENGGNWINFLGGHNYMQNATAQWEQIALEFDVYTVFPYHKLSFELGIINTNIYFDNVELVDIGLVEKISSIDFDKMKSTIRNPGFRPESDYDKLFLSDFNQAKFNVYPTIIRTPTTLTWSADLSKDFAKTLKEKERLKLKLIEVNLDPGELQGRGQFEFFKNDLKNIGTNIAANFTGVDYHIVPEILFAPERNNTTFVFGIHMYILNSEGENVFSFLMNSHHELFAKAKLYAHAPTRYEMQQLYERAIEVGLLSFRLMLDNESI